MKKIALLALILCSSAQSGRETKWVPKKYNPEGFESIGADKKKALEKRLKYQSRIDYVFNKANKLKCFVKKSEGLTFNEKVLKDLTYAITECESINETLKNKKDLDKEIKLDINNLYNSFLSWENATFQGAKKV